MADKVTHTKKVRLSVDVEFNNGFNAADLKEFAKAVETTICEDHMDALSIEKVEVVETIPHEPNFDWQGQ